MTVTREEDLFSLIDSKSFTSSGDEDGSPYCVLVEEEVEVVEAPQVLTIEEEEEEESSTIFSPHFSDPLLCSINRPSSTIVSVRYMHGHWTTFIFKQYSIQRRNDETRLVLEASGDFLLEEEDAPVTILEEVQDAEMEVDFSNSTFSSSVSYFRRCRRQSWRCWRSTPSKLCELIKYFLRAVGWSL